MGLCGCITLLMPAAKKGMYASDFFPASPAAPRKPSSNQCHSSIVACHIKENAYLGATVYAIADDTVGSFNTAFVM
jgi:hypothetical protein